MVKISVEVVLMQNAAKRDAPVRDDAESVLPGFQDFQRRQDIREDLPARMLFKFLANALADFRRRWMGVQQGKAGIKKNGTDRLRLFQWHYWFVPLEMM